MKNVICARCVKCGKEYEATADLENCSCGGILDIVYDYDYIKTKLTKDVLKDRRDYSMASLFSEVSSAHIALSPPFIKNAPWQAQTA